MPTGLVASNVTTSGVSLSWNASSDNGGPGVGGYYIYRNGNTTTPVATVTSGTAFSDTGLTDTTTYTYQVAAFDKSTPATVSTPSSALSVTTQSVSSFELERRGHRGSRGSRLLHPQRRHVHGQGLRGRHLQLPGCVPVRLPGAHRGWLDHCTRGQPEQHQSLGQGRGDDPRDSRQPVPPTRSCHSAPERCRLPGPPHHGGSQRHHHLWSESRRPLLGASGPRRQHLPWLRFGRWAELDLPRPDHDQHGLAGLHRSGGHQSQQRHLSTALFDIVNITGRQLQVTPHVAAITPWQSQQFTAAVSGGITWSVRRRRRWQ